MFMLLKLLPRLLTNADLSQVLPQSFIVINHKSVDYILRLEVGVLLERKPQCLHIANMNLHSKKQISCEE